jgi:hypothetical protein
MKTSQEIAKVSAAVVKAQAAIETVTKDGQNTFFKKADGTAAPYATLDAIIDACKKPLADNGLAVIQFPTGEGEAFKVITRVQHESGEYFESETPLLLGKKDMQGYGAAVTYAKRFALGSFFNIAAEVDDDGNAAAKGADGGKGQVKRQELLQVIENGLTLLKADRAKYVEHLCQTYHVVKDPSELNDASLNKAVIAMNQRIDKEKSKKVKNENPSANQ